MVGDSFTEERWVCRHSLYLCMPRTRCGEERKRVRNGPEEWASKEDRMCAIWAEDLDSFSIKYLSYEALWPQLDTLLAFF